MRSIRIRLAREYNAKSPLGDLAMQKVMKPVEVSKAEDGTVVIHQPNEMTDGESIWVSSEQVPTLVEWLLEAAGIHARATEEGRKPQEVRAMAHMFRCLEQQIAEDQHTVDEISPARGVRIALDWAAGDSDTSPDDWYFPDAE